MIPYDPETLQDASGAFLSEDGSILAVDSLAALHSPGEAWWEFIGDFVTSARESMGRGCCLVCTNQVRQKLSIDPGRTFVSDTESALRYDHDLFDTRLEISREQVSFKNYQMLIEVQRSPMARPGKWVKVGVRKGEGIELGMDLLDVALSLGVVTRAGSHFYFQGVRLGQGRKEAIHHMEQVGWMQDEMLDIIYDLLENTGA
jgi:recombination protein RecA